MPIIDENMIHFYFNFTFLTSNQEKMLNLNLIVKKFKNIFIKRIIPGASADT